MKKWIINLICTVAIVLIPTVSFALPVFDGVHDGSGTWTTPIGAPDGRSAEAVFELDSQGGGDYNMVVTLTNTSTVGIDDLSGILTGIMFNIPNDINLTPISAAIGPESGIVVGGKMVDLDTTSPSGEVGGEWAYNADLDQSEGDPTPLGAKQGIGSSGLDGIFGSPNEFNLYFADPEIHNLQGPENVNGIQYGILGEGWFAPIHAGGLDNNSFVRDQIIFTLSGLSEIVDPDAYISGISGLSFHYGTSYTAIPEPPTLFLFLSGVALFWGLKRKETDS